MKWNTPGLTSRTRHMVRVDHEGFFNGAHGVELRKGLDESGGVLQPEESRNGAALYKAHPQNRRTLGICEKDSTRGAERMEFDPGANW